MRMQPNTYHVEAECGPFVVGYRVSIPRRAHLTAVGEYYRSRGAALELTLDSVSLLDSTDRVPFAVLLSEDLDIVDTVALSDQSSAEHLSALDALLEDRSGLEVYVRRALKHVA